MSRKDRIKRQVLLGAVDENIETLRGKPLGTMRRQRERRKAALRRAATGTAIVALVAVSVTAWFSTANEAANSSVTETTAPILPLVSQRSVDARTEADAVEQLNRNLSAHDPDTLIRQVLPLRVLRVAIDPGHGGRDSGTSLSYGLLEKDLTRDIADRLARKLEAASVEAVLVRTGDEAVSLKERARRANASKADLFVSIHVNWLPNRNSRGVETYYLGTTNDPFLNGLAASENRDSGYSMADLRNLLEGIYADVRQTQSRNLADAVQISLFETLKTANDRIVSRGVMSAPFVVLVATEMPAILAEVACLSNENEARLLALPDYRERIADALFSGITRYTLSVSRPADALVEKGTQREQGKL